MSDDLLDDVARIAIAPLVEATPPLTAWDELAAGVGPPRAQRSWSPLMAATAAALGATAVVFVAVLIARGSPVPDVAAPEVLPQDGAPEFIIDDTSSRFESPFLDVPADPFS